MMFHGIDEINADLWGYATNVILYPTVQRPTFKTLENPSMRRHIKTAWEQLDKDKSKKTYFYDALEVKLRGQYRTVPISGRAVQKI